MCGTRLTEVWKGWLVGRNIGSDIGPVVRVGERQARLELAIGMWDSVPLELIKFDFNIDVLVNGGDVVWVPVRDRVWEVAYDC